MRRLNYVTTDEWWDTDVNILKDLVEHYDLYVYVLSPAPKRCKYSIKEIKGCSHLCNINYRFRKRNLLSFIFMFEYYVRAVFAAHKKGCINFCMYGWHPFLIPFFLYLFPRKNTILSAHNYQVHSHSRYDVTKFFYKRYRHFHFHSKLQMDLFLKDYPKGKAFYTQMLPKDFGSPNGLFSLDKQKKKVLLAFGLIRKYKRLDLLIEAVNKLNSDDVLVLIAGYSGDFSGYEAMIKDKSKFRCEIRFIDNAEIADMFTISDFLVLPYDDATQSGPSLIALNYGLPIIASDLPAFKELIEEGANGYLFRKGSVESLSMVIDRALKLSSDELFILKSNQYSAKSKYIRDNNPFIKFDRFINNIVLK